MSATAYHLICCDRCGHSTSGGLLDMRTTQREARRVAKAQGWRYIGPAASPRYRGQDVCPICQGKL